MNIDVQSIDIRNNVKLILSLSLDSMWIFYVLVLI